MKDYTLDKYTKKYSRNRYYEYDNCVNKLSTYYNNDKIILLNSGLQANYLLLYTIIMTHKNKVLNIIYFNDIYYETILLFNYIKKLYNVLYYKFNDFKLFDDLSNDINIIFIESCSNPFGVVFDFDMINIIRKKCKKSYIICDNTWLTHNIINPLKYDIDVLTTSLSKYYSINTVICGCCIYNNIELYNVLNEYVNITGLHISKYTVEKLYNTICNVNTIMIHLSDITNQIIDYLLFNNIIVCHPFLKNHESYNLAKKYFNELYSSTFLIGFTKKLSNLKFILSKLSIFNIEVSFGSYHTKIDPLVFYKDNISYIRISIGYLDSYDKIINGINELINIINNDNLYKISL